MLPAFADFLVPHYLCAASDARPFLFLKLEPSLDAIFPDIFQITLHRPMMRPCIMHECMQFLARIVAAMTAESDAPVTGAFPELAVSHPIVDPVAAAAVAVFRPACAAIETAGTVL